MKWNDIKNSAAILAAALCLTPSFSHALCLENCQQEARRLSSSASSLSDMTSDMSGAERNIYAGDVKNSVFGDMNIRVGHERVDIKTESNSNKNTIDTSINSTIILGDMKK